MKRTWSKLIVCCALGGAPVGVTACEVTEPTEASVVNGFPKDGDSLTVVKVWYRSTLFLAPVAPGTESESLRVATGSEPVYALLAPARFVGADAGTSPLVPARTRDAIALGPGQRTTITLSPATMLVGCRGAGALSPADYDVIATRIFPGDLQGPMAPPDCSGGQSDGGTSILDAASE